MKLKFEKTNNLLNAYLSLERDKWISFQDKAKKELIANFEKNGFRKGKVPVDIILNETKEADILSKAVSIFLDENRDEIFTELAKEKIITSPEVKITKISNLELELLFSAVLLPDIELADFALIDLKYKEKKVTAKDVQDELDKIKHIFEEKKKHDDDHQIAHNDIVNIDFSGKIDDQEFEGGTSKNYDLVIGSKSFIADFEDQLIGLKTGDQKEILVNFPDPYYPQETLSGKSAKFDVAINSISQKIQLEGEELLKRLKEMNFDSWDELKARIKTMLVDQEKFQTYNNYFDEFTKKIVALEATKFEIPQILIDHEIEHQLEHFKEKLIAQEMKLNDYFKYINISEEEFKETKLKPVAIDKLRNSLIYNKLVNDFKISEPPTSEIEKEYQKIADTQKMSIEKVKEQVSSDEIVDMLVFSKLIKKIRTKIESKSK